MEKFPVFVAVFAVTVLSLVPARGELLIKPGDRLAICGDPSSAEVGYATYMESYLLGSQQALDICSQQFGGSQDLMTELLPFHPTVVTFYNATGIADNGTGTPDPQQLDARCKGEAGLIQALKKMGVRTIVLASPICADSTLYHSDPAKAVLYNKVLAAVAATDKDVAAKEGAVYADVYETSLDAMTRLKARFGPAYPFNPENAWAYNEISRLTIAGAILKGLGCNGNIGSISIDFVSGKTEGSGGARINSYQDWVVNVEASRYPLAFPGHGVGPGDLPRPEQITTVTPFSRDLNRSTLTVKNLPSPKAKIWVGKEGDQTWRDYTREELAKGVNLAADMVFPTDGQSDNITALVSEHERNTAPAARAAHGPGQYQAVAQPDDLYKKAAASIKPVSFPIQIVPLVDYEKQPPGPIPVIVDTDISGDVDDVFAVALLNLFTAHGEAKLLAACVNMHDLAQSSGAVVHAINAYYGHPDVPIGAYHGADALPSGSAYTQKIREQFDPNFPSDDKLPPGVDVYRKALAGAADHSVVICSIGFLGNLRDLMDSKPDAVSPLAGPDLIKLKVRKMVVMANTVKEDAPLLDKWPTPILWSIEVGSSFGCGQGLQSQPDTNPAKIAARITTALTGGRSAWDPSAAWLAVRGPGDLFDVTWGGYWKVGSKGWGTWVTGPPTLQNKAIVKMPSDQVSKLFNDELARSPK